MKIFCLEVPGKLQPEKQPFRYPAHNRDYGVEQDFLLYLKKHPESLTSEPTEAEWHYLPVFWTRWHLNHDYGKQGLEELGQEIAKVLLEEKKTFTVCQYDDGPLVPVKFGRLFLASRKGGEGFDIPLLSQKHRKPFFGTSKKYLASFMGRVSTHPVRQEMAAALEGKADIFIHDGDGGSRFFVQKTLQSLVALCPRGYGGSSFRFFEAMQLGVVPCLIGDLDTRPFKGKLSWDEFSIYVKKSSDIMDRLYSVPRDRLLEMGKKAAHAWSEHLCYQQWCRLVIQELESGFSGEKS